MNIYDDMMHYDDYVVLMEYDWQHSGKGWESWSQGRLVEPSTTFAR